MLRPCFRSTYHLPLTANQVVSPELSLSLSLSFCINRGSSENHCGLTSSSQWHLKGMISTRLYVIFFVSRDSPSLTDWCSTNNSSYWMTPTSQVFPVLQIFMSISDWSFNRCIGLGTLFTRCWHNKEASSARHHWHGVDGSDSWTSSKNTPSKINTRCFLTWI